MDVERQCSWLSRVVDRLILARAIAGMSDGSEVVDPEHAEGVLLVFDEWLIRPSPDREWRYMALGGGWVREAPETALDF